MDGKVFGLGIAGAGVLLLIVAFRGTYQQVWDGLRNG